MNKNLALTILWWFCTLVQIYLLLILVIFIVAPIILHYYQITFLSRYINMESFSFMNVFNYNSKTTTIINGERTVYPILSILFMYLYYAQLMAITILSLLSVQEFKKFIVSTKKFQTFFFQNVQSFKKISRYALIVFLISSVNWMIIGDSRFFSFQINLLPLLVALLAFTFSEVFKEGNSILDENKATI